MKTIALNIIGENRIIINWEMVQMKKVKICEVINFFENAIRKYNWNILKENIPQKITYILKDRIDLIIAISIKFFSFYQNSIWETEIIEDKMEKIELSYLSHMCET